LVRFITAAISIVSVKISAFTGGVMKTMFVLKLKIAAGMLTLSLLVGGVLVNQSWALDTPDRSKPGPSNAKKPMTAILGDQFDKLRALIKPKPGGFDDLPWMTDLWEARKKAAAQGKPLLVWVGDGHPLGWT
jgi:hypothetical protein